MVRPTRQPLNLLFGQRGEDDACRFLKQQGLTLISRNYRCRYGEIDLIMQDTECLVFVEVRLRSPNRFASAAQTVDDFKQQKIIRAATHYLQSCKNAHDIRTRFDVVTFDPQNNQTTKPAMRWIRDAFRA